MKQYNILNRLIAILIVVAMLFGLSACSGMQNAENNSENKLEKYSGAFFDAFDTQISLIAYCSSQNEFDALLDMVKEKFCYYHQLFDIYHTYDGINNICTVNSLAGTEPVKVSEEIIDLIKLGTELNKDTNGKVNIALGSVLRIWHDARTTAENFPDQAYVPALSALQAANEHVNIDDVIISEADMTIKFADPDLKLDVGSVAKGYATEQVATMLENMGLDHIIINAGGNVRAVGSKPTGSWIIGIQNPDKSSENAYVTKVMVDGLSVVTSGVYERNYEFGGKVYHHIINPETLFPENTFQSVSILTKDSGRADAYSTAFFNMTLEEGQAFAKEHDLNAMWILNDFSIVMTDGFASLIQE